MYKRAGYEDKIPEKADREKENYYKRVIDKDRKYRDVNQPTSFGPSYNNRTLSSKASAILNHEDDLNDKLNELDDRNVNYSELHKRINNRAKSQNESISSINELRARLLIEASELLGDE